KRRNSLVAVEPIRKSLRLQAQTNVKQSKLLPSPSTSRTPPKVSNRKRKAALLEDNPDRSQVSCEPRRKRLQTRRRHLGCPEEPARELEAQETEQKERQNPISYWATHHTWPKHLAEHDTMSSSNRTNKRKKTSDLSQGGKDVGSRSYSQSRKDGEVPEQYTAAYQAHILSKGLDMDWEKGQDFASKESKKTCAELLRIDINTVEFTAVPQDKIRGIINSCQNRNEGIVHRDITSLIIPSIRLLYYCGVNDLKHIVDEVKAVWYQQCVLEGPRPCPDLAIGLFSSAFTEEEIEKLDRYTSVDNWTRVTPHMFFPFLMCEVKCGRDGLDMADRQNMHSCSVAVRAILRIEQEADKYRQDKKIESLNGQVLVFSISHDQQDARLYGHYSIVQGERWSYYRYAIQRFYLIDNNSLLAIYNFVQNILKSYAPGHVQRLKDALAALPDPNKPPESTGLSSVASEISLNDDDNSQQDSQSRDADGFVVPPRPRQLLKLLEEQREERRQEREEAKEAKQRESRLVQMLEEQREEAKQRESLLMRMLEEQREERRQEREEAKREREKAEQERLEGKGAAHADVGGTA
ncbi:MAG: hypothetical protein Q9163_004262, partial [Psora crenata]